jgi:hypothetical protein
VTFVLVTVNHPAVLAGRDYIEQQITQQAVVTGRGSFGQELVVTWGYFASAMVVVGACTERSAMVVVGACTERSAMVVVGACTKRSAMVVVGA